MVTRKFIQYNMWKNCNVGCKFCFNRGQKRSTIQDQIDILNFVIDKLNSSETDQYNEIGLIGGEFFDDQLSNPTVQLKFYEIIDICAKKYKYGKLNKFYIATSLIYDINKYFIPFINYIVNNNLIDITLICTSFDIKYRFHTMSMLKTWIKNMHITTSLINKTIHTEIIVTQAFINAVLNNTFNIQHFKKRFNSYIDFIEPTFIDFYGTHQASINSLPDFFPTRSSFMSFVKHMCINTKLIDIESFLSIKLRSDTSYYKLDSGEWLKIDNRWTNGIRRVDKYGNVKTLFSYSDSDKNMIHDIDLLRNGVL